MATKQEPQANLFDRTVEDPIFEEYLADWAANKEAAKTYSKANRAIADKAREHKLQDGERLRVGEYVIEGRARAGGGFEVPEWHSTTVGRITTA